MGFLLRIYFDLKIGLNTARLRAAEFEQHLREELARRPDPIFQESLTNQLELLQPYITSNDYSAEQVTAAVTAAQAKLQSCNDDFLKRRLDFQTAMNTLNNSLGGDWALPPAFASLVEAGQGVLVRAITESSTNVVGAQALLAGAKKDLLVGFKVTANSYHKQLDTDMIQLDLTVGTVPELAEPLTQLKAEVAKLPITESSIDIAAVLRTLHDINVKFNAAAFAMGTSLLRIVSIVFNDFTASDVSLPDATALQALERSTQSFASQLSRPAFEDSNAIKQLNTQIAAIKGELKTVINSQTSIEGEDPALAAENATARKDIGALINKGTYRDAVLKVIEMLRKNGKTQRTDTLLDKRKISTLLAVFPAAPASLDRTGKLLPFVQLTDGPDRTGRNISAPVQLQRRIGRFNLGYRTAILVMIVGMGYLIFYKSFVGTVTDFASVFFWAFTIDISVASITALIARMPKT